MLVGETSASMESDGRVQKKLKIRERNWLGGEAGIYIPIYL